jgi:hypothetical protein
LVESFVAKTTRPVELLTFCFVEVALFKLLLLGSWITGVPEPLLNEIAPIGEVFS